MTDIDVRTRDRVQIASGTCHYNFTYGPVNGDNCTNPASQRMIESPADCKVYGKMECADESCLRNPFELENATGDFERFPWKCFRDKDGKWGYNNNGKQPGSIGEGAAAGAMP